MRSVPRGRVLGALLAMALGFSVGTACADEAVGNVFGAAEFGAQLRAQWQGQQAAEHGPLASAAALQPGSVALPRGVATLAAELHAQVAALAGIVTLQQRKVEGAPAQSDVLVNELNVSGALGAWQFSAGKKILGWDVGQGFRPNDLVQQEPGRFHAGLRTFHRFLLAQAGVVHHRQGDGKAGAPVVDVGSQARCRATGGEVRVGASATRVEAGLEIELGEIGTVQHAHARLRFLHHGGLLTDHGMISGRGRGGGFWRRAE